MKKVMIVSLSFLLLFSLTGCGSENDNSEGKNTGSNKKPINVQLYSTIENTISANVRYYVMEKGIQNDRIDFDTLIEEEVIDKEILKDVSDNSYCDGYVVVENGKVSTFLNCNNYKTDQ